MDTFIVRVWRPELAGPDARPVGVRGVVTHLASGHEQVFRTPAELVTFLVDTAGTASSSAPAPTTDGRGTT